jgi:signal peptidase I
VHLKEEKNIFFDWFKTIAITAIFFIAIRAFLFSPINVEGASMMPTYQDGDRVIINKLEKMMNGIERFDVVVFKANESENYIKRVIGLPGDHIAYQNDELYINGEKYEEPYLEQFKLELKDAGKLTFDFTLEEIVNLTEIPEGYYFVLGDNRRVSNDSRNPSVGLISKDQILGEVNIRFYPFDHMGLVK